MARRRTLAEIEARGLTPLVYELLDAHEDTARLTAADGLAPDPRWDGHLRYLRDLQRTARELLAAADAGR